LLIEEKSFVVLRDADYSLKVVEAKIGHFGDMARRMSWCWDDGVHLVRRVVKILGLQSNQYNICGKTTKDTKKQVGQWVI
jgi:hypothetical protein